MLTLHDFPGSGNGYKVRLLLTFLGQPFDYRAKDILKGETRTPEFLALNPNGKIPVLVLEDGTPLAESNAILFYLAEGTKWLPDDRLDRARVLSWMFFEQYSHEPHVAVLRFWRHFLEMTPELEAQVPAKEKGAHAAFTVMERRLSGHDWLVGGRATIADIALYGYTHVADEAGLDLAPYPGIRGWLRRIAELPGYVPMGGP